MEMSWLIEPWWKVAGLKTCHSPTTFQVIRLSVANSNHVQWETSTTPSMTWTFRVTCLIWKLPLKDKCHHVLTYFIYITDFWYITCVLILELNISIIDEIIIKWMMMIRNSRAGEDQEPMDLLHGSFQIFFGYWNFPSSLFIESLFSQLLISMQFPKLVRTWCAGSLERIGSKLKFCVRCPLRHLRSSLTILIGGSTPEDTQSTGQGEWNSRWRRRRRRGDTQEGEEEQEEPEVAVERRKWRKGRREVPLGGVFGQHRVWSGFCEVVHRRRRNKSTSE